MEKVIDKLANECDTIYYNHNEHYRAKIEMETREERFNKWIENKFPKKLKKEAIPSFNILDLLRMQLNSNLFKKLVISLLPPTNVQ